MRLFSPDSTHWYTCHGTPLHTVKGANGEYRPTTLRDAKKWRLLPSVTNIIGIIQKEGISQWKMNHCVEAALTLPRRPGEDLGAFAQRVAEDAEQAMSKSAEFGTEFHAGAQRVAENPLGLSENEPLYEWLAQYRDWMDSHVDRVLWTERVLVNQGRGYAGTADMLCVHRTRGMCLVDLKTQGVKPKKLPRIYPSWQYQLAAYQQTLGKDVTCMNLIISSQEPVVVGEHFWSQAEIDAGWEVFKAAQFIWAQEKGYTPGIIESPGTLPDSSESPSSQRSLPTDAETCR